MAERIRFSDAQRRARLVARHHLGRAADGVVAAVGAVVALHSSDPVTPYLSAWARVPGFKTADLDRALHDDRTLWRLHAMRRTLFVVPADDAAVFDAAAGRDIAAKERRKLEQWVAAEVAGGRVRAWLAGIEARVLDVLADGRERRTPELTAAIPELDTALSVGSGKWAGRTPLSSRLLFLMALEGHVVRTRPAGTWRSSQYHWAAASRWFERGGAPEDGRGAIPGMDAASGRAELARRYLSAYGPATLADLRWWTGWTVAQATKALHDGHAVAVDLEAGREGYVLADDLSPVAAGTPSVALLPGLDSTPMGWKERDWFLGAHREWLFDRNGNVGPTVWVDGRIVGGWAQRPGGEVVTRLLEDVGGNACARVGEQAQALQDWMAGVVAIPRFRTPLERELSA